MNVYDLQRAITLVDDKYITDAYRVKRPKNKALAAVVFAAAMCAAVMFLLSYSSIPSYENSDYEDYFVKTSVEIPAGCEDTYDTMLCFEHDYIEKILPFDISGYEKGYSDAYCDDSGRIKSVDIVLIPDGNISKTAYIRVSEGGAAPDYLPFYESDGTKRYGSRVYCFESDDMTKYVYFQKDGLTYLINTWGVGYDEIGYIADSLLISGINFGEFDPECAIKYTTDNLPIEECDMGTVFEGIIPEIKSIGGKHLEDGMAVRQRRYKNGEKIYEKVKAAYGTGSEFFIVQFISGEEIGEHYSLDTFNVYNISELDRSMLESAASGEWDTYNHYQIILDCGYFYIEITANCSEDELWEYVEAIRTGQK